MKAALRLLVVACMLCWLSACTNYHTRFEKPEVKITQVQHIASSGLLQQRFRVGLQLTNPNDYPLDLQSIHFNVSVADRKLISGVAGNLPKIPAYGSADFNVEGSANILELGSLLQQLLKNPQDRLEYQVDGTVHLRSGFPRSFPLRRQGELSADDWLH